MSWRPQLLWCTVVLQFGSVLLDRSEFSCIHNEISQAAGPSAVVHVNYDSFEVSRAKRSAPQQPIRIKFDYTYLDATPSPDADYTCYEPDSRVVNRLGLQYACRAADVLTPARVSIIKETLLPEALRRIQSYVSLYRSVPGNLTLAPKSCFPYPITQPLPVPDEYLQYGAPDADLVVFVTARPVPPECALTSPAPSGCDAGDYTVLAFAGDCLSDGSGRSVGGFMNFNPALLPLSPAATKELHYAAAVHELTHVLGFTNKKLAALFDPSTNTSRPTDWALFNDTASGVAWVVTPTVVAEAREQFGCTFLPGALLENRGGAATAGSHWEAMSFNNEMMTGKTSRDPVLSRVTLALLADMGWYSVDLNTSVARPLLWGYQQGCSFGAGQCSALPLSPPYRCSAATAQETCNAGRTAKSHCVGSSSLDSLTGTCLFYQGYQNGYCSNTDNSPPLLVSDRSGEAFGPDSRCFDSSVAARGESAEPSQGCYNIRCASPTRLKIKVDDVFYSCPGTSPAKTFTPIGYSGSITCPSDNLLCLSAATDPNWPEITSIQPAQPAPGDSLVINGYGFTAGSTITALVECSDVVFVNASRYTCKLAGLEVLQDSSINQGGIHLVLRDSQGRTAVLLDLFPTPPDLWYKIAIAWIVANPLYSGAGGGCLLLLILIVVVCLYKFTTCCRRRCCCCCKNDEDDEEYSDDDSQDERLQKQPTLRSERGFSMRRTIVALQDGADAPTSDPHRLRKSGSKSNSRAGSRLVTPQSSRHGTPRASTPTDSSSSSSDANGRRGLLQLVADPSSSPASIEAAAAAVLQRAWRWHRRQAVTNAKLHWLRNVSYLQRMQSKRQRLPQLRELGDSDSANASSSESSGGGGLAFGAATALAVAPPLPTASLLGPPPAVRRVPSQSRSLGGAASVDSMRQPRQQAQQPQRLQSDDNNSGRGGGEERSNRGSGELIEVTELQDDPLPPSPPLLRRQSSRYR